ncbi:hypothetical protein BaRGS_00015296 [Batillaria attramentaria]|uniref:Tubulin-specific chaperone E n=1 Tax=Batillaria attramentaria TaxID=370345 RepID=A0ABD0L230_9CAEN
MAADDADLLRADGSKVQVGDRVAHDEYVGTVKYIGSVPPTKGVWLGVEWDDPSRGKHNGCHEGVKYFETSHPTSGSFVRPKKVDLGVDCLFAIKDRYGKQEEGVAGVDMDELYVLSADNKATVVEMVGAEKINKKQSQLNLLVEVSLRGMNIYGIQPEVQLSDITPNVHDLDLSRNLIASWDMVARICRQLPHLQKLYLSENRLASPEDPQELSKAFTTVISLSLNKMSLTWEKLLQIFSMFQNVEKLYICDNGLQTLSDPQGDLQHLTMLSLELNHISKWEEILKLGRLGQLETLVLADNGVESIYFPDVPHGQKTQLFPKLRQLYLQGNRLSDWSSFDEMNKLQSLEELLFGSLPHLGEMETVRETIIAKIARLSRCNRTLVEEQERKGAEIDYLKRYGPAWLKAGGNQDLAKSSPSPEFVAQHPRFQELVEKWGAPETSEMKQQTKSLKDSLITLKFHAPQRPDVAIFEKKLPSTMTVAKLRTLVQRLYQLDGDFVLSYISQKMKGPEIEFDNDLRQMSFFSVESGDTIQVKWCT